MSSTAVRESLAALGVIASMVFVGLQIRQSNIQARAAAFQEIGIATAEAHRVMGCPLAGQGVASSGWGQKTPGLHNTQSRKAPYPKTYRSMMPTLYLGQNTKRQLE